MQVRGVHVRIALGENFPLYPISLGSDDSIIITSLPSILLKLGRTSRSRDGNILICSGSNILLPKFCSYLLPMPSLSFSCKTTFSDFWGLCGMNIVSGFLHRRIGARVSTARRNGRRSMNAQRRNEMARSRVTRLE